MKNLTIREIYLEIDQTNTEQIDDSLYIANKHLINLKDVLEREEKR